MIFLQGAKMKRRTASLFLFWSLHFSRPGGLTAFLQSKLSMRHRKHIRCDHESLFSHSRFGGNCTESRDDDVAHNKRRSLAQALAMATMSVPLASHAGIPEIDDLGLRFGSKTEMLSGGSEDTRGIPLKGSRPALKPGETLQTVYGTRFITYLSRFFLNFDSAAHSWWLSQGYGQSWERQSTGSLADMENSFAEFAESVEVGLADYFVGPYGSYSTLSAARAGILASNPAPSLKPVERRGLVEKILLGNERVADQRTDISNIDSAKQGIRNLFTLLQARYKSVSAKRQLAILFSFINAPQLQPSDQIRSILGEADNATISQIRVIKSDSAIKEEDSRTSARRGGGYELGTFPTVTVASPPALGSDYKQTEARPIMELTSRILQIDVIDGGEGYSSVPQVFVVALDHKKPCQATAILDRKGRVESIIVLDPGFGYGVGKGLPPQISIEPPKAVRNTRKGSAKKKTRRARAIASLEYEIVGVEILSGGSGFVKTEPPEVSISPPPSDPDWFIAVQALPELRMRPLEEKSEIQAVVSEMRFSDGNVAFSMGGIPRRPGIDGKVVQLLQRDPLEMLPSFIRPELLRYANTDSLIYTIPSIAAIPEYVPSTNPRYRAQDPVFGVVGTTPVTKGAKALSSSEYVRLALSGAVCTVLVRTALNPLELIKTKQQLKNDDELFAYARGRVSGKSESASLEISPAAPSIDVISGSGPGGGAAVATLTKEETGVLVTQKKSSESTEGKLGTFDIIKGMISLRGPGALFQSADITFLASLVFGSFGFGATELFRRSFYAFFFSEGGGESALGNEVTLLLAAAVATVVTAAAASPFEVLRVRSMGSLKDKKVTEVLQDFVAEKSGKSIVKADGSLDWKELSPGDLLPLWSGFAPILSRELPFALAKFLVFDLIASTTVGFINSKLGEGALPLQIGVGPLGLTISAAAGAVAGIAGAIVSHPADLILTKTSARARSSSGDKASGDWRVVVKELVNQEGGIANLFVGLPARSTFFFLVIGLQFFLYDYVKGVFQVSSDDLSLVLDVFYAVRAGLDDA